MSAISATVSDTAWVADTSRTVGIISATILLLGENSGELNPLAPFYKKGESKLSGRRPRSRATHGGSSEDFVGEEAPEARVGSLAPLDS